MGNLERYLITWLLYGNEEAASLVGYTADEKEWDKYLLIIRPNGHLGKDWVYPDWNHPTREGKVIELDMVYNVAFFTSRAEEVLNTRRDAHGRFLAQYSILGEANRLQIPMLDEYSRFLIKALKQACEEADIDCPVHLPKGDYNRICLTHDVDILEQYRHLRGAVGGIMRGQWRQVWRSWMSLQDDPAYTFPWLMDQDHDLIHRYHQREREWDDEKEVTPIDVIYFIKHTHGKGYDYPQYNRHGRDWEHLRDALKRSGARIGIHSSYYGYEGHTLHTDHRSHYLRCDIDNMQRLADGGVSDDYTMMFPDMCGFRLQTSRPIRWINPKTMQLTGLTLHPLIVMDCTLSNEEYMHLSEDEAYFYCQRLFDKVKQNGGELVVLWHNIDPGQNPYHHSLYQKLIELIDD